jgi:hypothetical protein
LGNLKDRGPVVWLEEGGKKLEEVVAILWEKSFPAFGGHMLKNASMNGCKSVVKFLVDGKKADVAYCGVNVSVCNNFISPEFPDPSIFSGDAPLALAALFGQFEIVKLLIEKDAPLNDCECECGRSALFYASEIGRLEIVNYLIEHGAIIDQDFHGWIHEYWISVLMVASQNGHLEVVKCLIQHGANVNAVDDGGKTALLLASEKGHLEVVKCLIERGANVDAADKDGWTGLLLASQNVHLEVVKWAAIKKKKLTDAVEKLVEEGDHHLVDAVGMAGLDVRAVDEAMIDEMLGAGLVEEDEVVAEVPVAEDD